MHLVNNEYNTHKDHVVFKSNEISMSFNELNRALMALNKYKDKGGRTYKLIDVLLQREVTAHSVEEIQALLVQLKYKENK